MSAQHAPGHRLMPASSGLPTMKWRCECGAWSGDLPPVGAYGHTTLRARMSRVTTAHDKHARAAIAKAAKST
jgi:hypothetical protein